MGCQNSRNQNKEREKSLNINKTPEGYKVVLLGDVAVGKTSVLWRFVKSEFLDMHTPTVGLAYFQSNIDLPGKVANDDQAKVTLNLWDTGGQAYFRDLVNLYYRDASAALLVFDRTNPASFQSLKDWISELEAKVDLKSMVRVRLRSRSSLLSQTSVICPTKS